MEDWEYESSEEMKMKCFFDVEPTDEGLEGFICPSCHLEHFTDFLRLAHLTLPTCKQTGRLLILRTILKQFLRCRGITIDYNG